MVDGEPEIIRWGFGLQNHIMWSLASALWALLCSQCCCTKNVYSWTQTEKLLMDREQIYSYIYQSFLFVLAGVNWILSA